MDNPCLEERKKKRSKVPCWHSGSSIVTVVALIAAVAWVQPLAQELPHVAGAAKIKRST